MVQINEAEFLEAMRKKRTENDAGLSDFDRDLIGKNACRLEIPFADLDQVAMRDVADVLHGLANTMDFWSRQAGHSQRDVLLLLRAAMREAVFRVRAIKAGR